MIVWESEDLVHWSETRAVTVGRENAGSVWAPEAVYVPEKEAFLVFWASHINTPDGKGGKFQIDCSLDKGFCRLYCAGKIYGAGKGCHRHDDDSGGRPLVSLYDERCDKKSLHGVGV